MFIKDLAIDIWSTSEKFDVNIYDNYPVNQVLDIHKSNTVSKDIVSGNILLLDRHEIETEDALMQLG